jgi:hypothetical protein
MYIGKAKKLSELQSNEADNGITRFIAELKLQISVRLNPTNIKAESRVLDRLIKESLDDLPPTTIFTAI